MQVTARFDMPGIKKQDVHVSFQRTRLVVTWQIVTITEREEEGRVVRERKEKTYSQSIPLPEGARASKLLLFGRTFRFQILKFLHLV